MCEPISASTLLIGGLSAATAATSYAAQSSSANAQAEYQNEVYTRTRGLATEDYLREAQVLGVHSIQDQAAVSEQAVQNRIAQYQGEGGAAATLADRGIDGNSVHLLMSDYERLGALNDSNIVTNFQNRQTQLEQEVGALKSEAANRIAGATPRPVDTPSLLGTSLQIATGLTGAYDHQQRINKTGPYSSGSISGFWDKPFLFTKRT
jgi:hypothetical protein